MSPDVSERSFEDAIECGLLRDGPDACEAMPPAVRETPAAYGGSAPGGYRKRDPGDYDRALCLLPRDVVDFVLATPPSLHAVRYKLAVDRYLAERGHPFEALVAFSGTVQDEGHAYTESNMNGFPEAQTASTFEQSEYRFLIVANKFQTGFDQPLLHTMYVDKKLGGVNAGQTLSRLNRTHPEKKGPLVLDFANEADDIKAAFEPYYETTLLSEATDPNLLYEIQAPLAAFPVYTEADVRAFATIYFDPKAAQDRLYAALAPAVDRFRELPAEEQADFRGQLTDYVRLYAFLAQVLTFADVDLEKLYVFSRHLRRLLPAGREELPREVQQNIDMEQDGVRRELPAKPGAGVSEVEGNGSGTGGGRLRAERSRDGEASARKREGHPDPIRREERIMMRAARSAVALLIVIVTTTVAAAADAPPAIGVVVMHGKGGSPAKYVSDLASALEGKGYLVANIEMPWSRNRNYDVTVEAAAQEVVGALATLRSRGAKTLFVAGHSQGGLFALYFAGRHPVDGVVAIAPGGSVDAPAFRDKVADSVATARKLVAEGKGGQTTRLLDYEGSRGTYPIVTTPGTYLTWFDPDGAMSVLRAIRALSPQTPVLYVAPTGDYPPLRRVKQMLFDALPKNPLTRLYEPASSHLDAPAASRDEVSRWTTEVASRATAAPAGTK